MARSRTQSQMFAYGAGSHSSTCSEVPFSLYKHHAYNDASIVTETLDTYVATISLGTAHGFRGMVIA
jgi:hypothetical protein